MSNSRRDFLRLATATSLTLAAGAAKAGEGGGADTFATAYGVLVDTVVCIGCRKCEWACNNTNSLTTLPPSAYEDKSVMSRRRRPTDTAFTVVNQFPNPVVPDRNFAIKIQCMHCNHPACVSACIVGALRKESSGPVTYDAWKCIGCRYCMVACPFQIPAYEYAEALAPRVRKCSFCADKLKTGERPACVGICPNEALTFGTRKELLEMAHSRIAANKDKYIDHVYGEKEAGGTSWMYLAGVNFESAGLPHVGNQPIPEVTETIQHGIFKSFVPPLALYGLLGLAMFTFRKNDAEKGDEDEQA